jgi:hypothetical protein
VTTANLADNYIRSGAYGRGDVAEACEELDDSSLESNQRQGKPYSCPVEEEPHSQRFGSLQGHQAHLSANVIAARKTRNQRLVILGFPLELRNSLFDGAAKSRTDLKTLIGTTTEIHDWLRGSMSCSSFKISEKSPKVFPNTADISE